MLIAAVAVAVAAAIAMHRFVLSRRWAAVAALRHAADESLWRRYNIVGDLIPWAANEGADATQALFQAVIAARAEIMKARSEPRLRLAAEDRLQAALNAFYPAAYADDDLLSVHEFVVVAAHTLKADERVHADVAAHDAALRALPKPPRWLCAVYRLPAVEPFDLSVAADHPRPEERPLA